jgi:hypothetical protein
MVEPNLTHSVPQEKRHTIRIADGPRPLSQGERGGEAGVRSFSAAATAAAIALLVVAWSMGTFPAVPLASRLDAVTNEWIIRFTGFYLPLFAAGVLLGRLRQR